MPRIPHIRVLELTTCRRDCAVRCAHLLKKVCLKARLGTKVLFLALASLQFRDERRTYLRPLLPHLSTARMLKCDFHNAPTLVGLAFPRRNHDVYHKTPLWRSASTKCPLRAAFQSLSTVLFQWRWEQSIHALDTPCNCVLFFVDGGGYRQHIN